jgi:hypothetical protein
MFPPKFVPQKEFVVRGSCTLTGFFAEGPLGTLC